MYVSKILTYVSSVMLKKLYTLICKHLKQDAKQTHIRGCQRCYLHKANDTQASEKTRTNMKVFSFSKVHNAKKSVLKCLPVQRTNSKKKISILDLVVREFSSYCCLSIM